MGINTMCAGLAVWRGMSKGLAGACDETFATVAQQQGSPPPCPISSLSSQKVTTYDLGGCSTARMPRSPASAASRMPRLVTYFHLRQRQRQGRQLAWLTPREATLGEARKNAQRRDLLGALALHLRSSSSTSPASRGDSRSIVSFNGAR